jgi:four helix bundle protein
MASGHRDLKVFQLAYAAGMAIFEASKRFPREELYSLTDQLRRSARSVAPLIAEGFRKRSYVRLSVLKLVEADAEASEAGVWLDYARDCKYLPTETHAQLLGQLDEVGRMLGAMIRGPEKFCPS